LKKFTRVEVTTVVKIETEVHWVALLCSVAVKYQCFRGPCCLHLQGEVTGNGLVESVALLHSKPIYMPPSPTVSHFTLKMEAARSFKTLISYHNTTHIITQRPQLG
jgi:hypothetical protein